MATDRIATALSAPPSVSVGQRQIREGETTTVRVMLSAAPNGLAGYRARVEVQDVDVARIVTASYPDAFGLTKTPRTSSNGKTVELQATDLDDRIRPGGTNVHLATITFRGVGAGETTISVSVDQMDDDSGGRMSPDGGSGTIAVEAPTRTPTRTATRSPDAVPYNLERASYYTPVELDGDSYRVLRQIPNTDATRRAVVTPEYELVDSETAHEALITETWMGIDFPLNYQAMLEGTKERRTKWMILEDLNRVADISTEVAASLGLLAFGPAAALGPALAALGDGVVWAANEVDDPYKEQYAKMSEAAGTSRWADQTFEGATSFADMTTEAIDFINLAMEIHGNVSDMGSIAQVAHVAVRTARAGGSISTGLVAGGAYGSAVLPQILITLATAKAVSGVTKPLELNARTAAFGAAQATVRLPILRRVIELRDRIANGTLGPPGIVEYKIHEMVQYEIGSAAAYGMAVHQGAIDETFLGLGYATLFNSEGIRSEALKLAQRYDNLAKYTVTELGAGMNEARSKLEDSINAEAFGTKGVI